MINEVNSQHIAELEFFSVISGKWQPTIGLGFDQKVNGIYQDLLIKFTNRSNLPVSFILNCMNYSNISKILISDVENELKYSTHRFCIMPKTIHFVKLIFIFNQNVCSNAFSVTDVCNIFQVHAISNKTVYKYDAKIHASFKDRLLGLRNCHLPFNNENKPKYSFHHQQSEYANAHMCRNFFSGDKSNKPTESLQQPQNVVDISGADKLDQDEVIEFFLQNYDQINCFEREDNSEFNFLFED